MEERTLSKQKEEPFNSKSKKIDYEKEFYQLLEFIDDVGLQMQVAVKNTKLRIKQEQQPPE